MNIGVGKVSLVSKLTGNNKIDSGVGKMNLYLIGTLDDYKISIDKGIGTAKIDGENVKDDSTYGTGINSLDIDGGIGSIDIEFKNLEE